MLVVETIAKIRRAYSVQGKSIKALCRELRVSRQVVRKVLLRERFFPPRLRVKSYDELNAWLLDHCVSMHAGRFDGFHAVPASVSKTCLVCFDKNKYSVSASAVGRPVEVRAYAQRIEIY